MLEPDLALGDEVRVTVIAAGFDGGQPPRRNQPACSMCGGSGRVLVVTHEDGTKDIRPAPRGDK